MDPSTVGTGIPNRSKIDQRSIYSWNRDTQSVQDRSKIHLQLEPGYPIGPRSIKDPSTVGTGIPNRSKIDQRSIYSWNRDTQSVQDRSKIHLQLEPGTQSVQDRSKIHLQLEPGYPIGPRSIKDPSTVGTGIPNRSKIDQWIHLQLEPGYPIGPRSIKDPSTVEPGYPIGPRSIKDPSTVGTGIPNRSKIDQRSIHSWNRDTQSVQDRSKIHLQLEPGYPIVQDRSKIHLQLEPGYPIGPRSIKDPSTVGTGIPNRSRSIKDPSTVGTGIPNRFS
ncbi:hypothetical protein L596_000192 [Steinernema carpocapsae]|uniref:Uncharacterized protein n=1 Tax=Steinernema carpocapsae TaxID=34508 RepID=A0A4U8UIH4_STECR|nr:hypothetical protein L596_000192 [Steinernema carpocapsae]